MITYIIWRDGSPGTAVRTQSWLARYWHEFRLGFPWYRVDTLAFDRPLSSQFNQWEIAKLYQEMLDSHRNDRHKVQTNNGS